MDGPRSNPYHPDPEKCCEACCFSQGSHAAWCCVKRIDDCMKDGIAYRKTRSVGPTTAMMIFHRDDFLAT